MHMLAKNDASSLIVVAFIVIAVIIGRVVEYFKKMQAEAEAKERKLRRSQTEGEGSEAPARPAARGGLQALLDALEGREDQADAPPAPTPEPFEEHSEVWEFDEHSGRTGERFIESATSSHDCDLDAASAAREQVIAAGPHRIYEQQTETKADAERLSEESAPPPPALAAAGILVGHGGASLRDQARRGILWSVLLGPPRATIPYGERGAAEAPGGLV